MEGAVSTKRFEGIFPVMMTAYDGDGNVDRLAMAHMTDYLIVSGVHGLVVLGSNGECPYLVHGQQMEAIDAVVEVCAGRVPVIVGVNERGTDASVKMARCAERAGADGLLVALHVFYPIDEKAVEEHYRRVCGEVGLPVLFYNFPSQSGLKLSPQAIARLSVIENLVGAKETIFDLEEVRALVEATNEDFCVFTGVTLNLVATMAAGACGAICPLPNLIPRKTLDLYEAVVSGDFEKAAGIQNELYAFAPLLAASPAPHAVLKEALRLLGHPIRPEVKSPLPPLTSQQADLAGQVLRAAGLISPG